jgi:hypothetical protein
MPPLDLVRPAWAVTQAGGIEHLRPPRVCLDILAQHLVSMATEDAYTEDGRPGSRAAALVDTGRARRGYFIRGLSGAQFLRVFDMEGWTIPSIVKQILCVIDSRIREYMYVAGFLYLFSVKGESVLNTFMH